MRILITAGGTSEKIDGVRSITNISTGRLSQAISSELVTIDNCTIDYVCARNTLYYDAENCNIHIVNSVSDLIEKIKFLLTQNKYDLIVHAMAVSDYYVSDVSTKEKLYNDILNGNDIKKTIFEHCGNLNKQSKIDSNSDNLLISLKKNPKVISIIKNMQPNTILIGFKLLNNVDLKELIDTAYNMLVTNNCDYVLANDLTNIEGEKHIGYLIDTKMNYKVYNSKNKIANAIYMIGLSIKEKL